MGRKMVAPAKSPPAGGQPGGFLWRGKCQEGISDSPRHKAHIYFSLQAPGGIALIGRKSGQRREIKKKKKKDLCPRPVTSWAVFFPFLFHSDVSGFLTSVPDRRQHQGEESGPASFFCLWKGFVSGDRAHSPAVTCGANRS